MMDVATVRLEEETDLEQGYAASDEFSGAAVNDPPSPQPDFFITENGMTFAGRHVIVDLYGARNLADPIHIEEALVRAAKAAGATVLSTDFHHFQPNGGVSGVVVLAESHISIHTWPERDFAAVDVFMCGDAVPMDTVPILKEAFAPAHIGLNELRRGVMP